MAIHNEIDALNKALSANMSNPPEEQSNVGNMKLEDMKRMLKFHTCNNTTSNRKKYITYWKENIANRILLEELEQS